MARNTRGTIAARLSAVAVLISAMGLAGCSDDAPETTSPVAAGPAAVTTPAETTADAAAPALTVPQLLAAASTAMREQRMVQPVGDNAIEYYLQVLDAEPENRQAQLAILELMPMAQGVTEQMIDGNRLDEAQTAVALLKRASPTSVIVTSLEQRIVAQRRSEEQKKQAEEEQTRLADARTREAAAAAARAPEVADSAEPPPAATTPARTPASSSSRSSAAASAAPPPATNPVSAPPTQVASASPAASVATQTSPQNQDFALTRRVNAQYPKDALRSRTEGWVELSFTVSASGDVEGVEVVNANPRRVFDREAVRALGQWKFTPRIENGKPVAAKARQRLEFNLN